MAKLSHNFEYAFTLFGVKLAQMLSPRGADKLGYRLGSIAYLLAGSRRKICRENLSLSMGNELTEKEIKETTLRVFQNIGRTLVEFSRFGVTSQERVREIIIGDGIENIEEAFKNGRGGIITTAHFGCWELLGAWFGCMGYPMNFLVGTQHNDKVDNLFIDFRKSMDVGIIPLKSSIRGVFKALKENNLVGLVSDQHTGSGLPIDFLGRKAAAAKGPATFAVKIGSPVLPYLMRRERFDRHVIMAGKPLYPDKNNDPEEEINRITIECNKFFEEGIRKYPDQWMWTHRRWKI
ncbi:MAG: lysophospholipid acyltransferase family protein [bacterium]